MHETRLLPDSKVAARYGISHMTLWRWDRDPTLNFPKPVRIRGRKYRDEGELDAFDAAQRAEVNASAAGGANV
jgi:predicted DNA-binding transcriptional regulator AlpA